MLLATHIEVSLGPTSFGARGLTLELVAGDLWFVILVQEA
jgi:hypothetical protein